MATPEQAASTVKQLPHLEYPCGLATCEAGARRTPYQWDFPNGWAPLHYIAVHGLARYGYQTEAKRIAEKYVRAIDKTFRQTGTLWEKYNVTDGSLNVTDEYEMPPMLGWTAGVYVDFMAYLTEQQQKLTKSTAREARPTVLTRNAIQTQAQAQFSATHAVPFPNIGPLGRNRRRLGLHPPRKAPRQAQFRHEESGGRHAAWKFCRPPVGFAYFAREQSGSSVRRSNFVKAGKRIF